MEQIHIKIPSLHQAGSNLINGQDDSRVTIDTTVGIRHPGFNFITLHDDVAVIQLPEPVPLSGMKFTQYDP